MLWVIVALSVVCALLMIYLMMMKKQLRSMKRNIERTVASDYDRRLLIELFDNDINELAVAINKCIDNQKKLKIDAELAEAALRRSVSDIAHDIRTPLAVVKGDLQLILREEQLPERCRWYADVCLAKTTVLQEMCNEFFELAVLESDRSRVKVDRINLTNLLMEFIAENEGVIRLAGLEPEINLPPKTVFVNADEALVRRIMGNLLGNVLKYSRDTFSLTLTEKGSVTVANPVSEHLPDTKMLFERAYRGSSARNGSGAGLGLYIVKLLAEKQGADVSASNDKGELAVTVVFESI